MILFSHNRKPIQSSLKSMHASKLTLKNSLTSIECIDNQNY